MNKFISFCKRNATKLGAATGITAVAVAVTGGVSGATGIETVFTTTQASLVTEIGYGVALVVALLVIGLGVRMLVKWSKLGVSKS